MLTQAEFMRNFNDKYREKFNPALFERNNDDIVRSIEQAVRSFEKDKYFTTKILDFQPIYDYEEIYNILRDYKERKIKKNSNEENPYDYINIRDTDMILIKVKWLVRKNGVERQEIDGQTIKVVNPEQIMDMYICVPKFTHKYYFRLSGNYYTANFQIVDGSTYNNSTANSSKSDTVTFKSNCGATVVFRSFIEMKDINHNEIIKVIIYNSIIYNNITNAMFYLFANFGYYNVCQYLDIHCIYLGTEPITRDDYLSFEKHGIYISVPAFCFEESVVQSMVATLYVGINKDCTINSIFNIRYWMRLLGIAYKNATIDKGLYVLDSVDTLYDINTHDETHLPEEDKKDIYDILRWMMREFSNLRIKENVDIRTKRIRIADYIGAILVNRLNAGIHRISDMGRRVTLKKIIQAINIDPMFIINSISVMSNLVSYRELVNDNDANLALKYTYKGISGLGEDGSSVQIVYRYVDPSHVGVLDLDSASSSDPGMTGIICPLAKLYGNSFSEYEEPNEWRSKWQPIKDKYFDGKEQPIIVDREEKIDYMAKREEVIQEELEINRVVCPIFNFKDPTIDYTIIGNELKQNKENEENVRNLFNIGNTTTLEY